MKPLLLTIAVVLTFACSHLFAQTGASKPGGATFDSMLAILQTSIGQPIELHLKSGEKIGGKVATVGSNIVHLSQVTGMELFDADVEIGDISAILAHAKKG